MCKLFRLIVPGCLKETVLKACAKYAASSLAKFELSRIIRIEQAISQEDIHASHESAEQGVESALPSSVSNLDSGRRWGFPPIAQIDMLEPL